MSVGQQNTNEVDIDLRRLFASLASRWLSILFWALVATAIAFALAWLATPKYRAETRLLIETRESIFTRPEVANNQASDPLLDEEGVTSQVEIIASTDILKQVAQKLDLAKLPEFDEAANLSAIDRLLIMTGLMTDPFLLPPEERVLKRFREKLQVYRVEKSRVIVIEFSSEDPKLAAEIPNAIADAYLAVSRAAKLDSNTDATSWLQPEIADLSKRVKEAEAKVADFRAKSDLLMGQGESILATQQLSELSTELSRVRASRATAEATAEGVRAAMRRGVSIDSLPKVLESPLIQRLREREVQLKADIADLSTTLLDNHPRIRALRSQLADMEGQISNEVRNVLNSLQTEAETARVRETQLVADLNRLKAESARAGDEEVELRALEREAAAQRELLESYLTRYREASSRGDRNYLPADARIFSRAVVPSEAYFPKMLPIVGAAFAGSLLLMVIITLLRELFSGNSMRYHDQRPAERRDARPAAAAGVSSERLLVAEEEAPVEAAIEPPVQQPVSALGEVTITQAVEKLIDDGAARVVFVSPEGDDGAAAAVMIAREAADSGLRVLLLDLTANSVPTHAMLETYAYAGITNLLASEGQFADVIHTDHYSESNIIPVGTVDAERAMRSVERLPIILDSLSTVYDLIVIECGAIDPPSVKRLVVDDSPVMISVLDPFADAVADTADAFRAAGYDDLTFVSPEGHEMPTTPLSGQAA